MTTTNAERTRSEILNALQFGECVLRYTKLDGSERNARATLNPELIPEECLPVSPTEPRTHSGQVVDPDPNDLIRYYDMDVSGWRTFFPENVLTLRVV